MDICNKYFTEQFFAIVFLSRYSLYAESQFFLKEMLHDTLPLELLQQVDEKECERLPHKGPRTDTLVNDTNKTMKNDKYPRLDMDDKKHHMTLKTQLT